MEEAKTLSNFRLLELGKMKWASLALLAVEKNWDRSLGENKQTNTESLFRSSDANVQDKTPASWSSSTGAMLGKPNLFVLNLLLRSTSSKA
jgi:hypothetical protein